MDKLSSGKTHFLIDMCYKKPEREPKLKVISLILGMGTLAAGYGIALTINGSLSSMLYFFIAAVLVIIGSYLCLYLLQC